MNKYKQVPDEIKGWSWGAFFLSWIWAIGNKTWIGFLVFVPFVGFIFSFVLGAKGREWAWKNKDWESVEHFNKVQKSWDYWGCLIFFITLLIFIIGVTIAITLPLFDKESKNTLSSNETKKISEISLGMRPLDVTLLKGKASNFNEKINIQNDYSSLDWYYQYEYEDRPAIEISFIGDTTENLEVSRVCGLPKNLIISNVYIADPLTETEIIREFGKPDNISIHKDGLSKWISYPERQIAFEISKSIANSVCLDESPISYLEEYKGL